jgi:hypothetical protein
MDGEKNPAEKPDDEVFANQNTPNGKRAQTFLFNRKGHVGYAVGKKHWRIEKLKTIASATKILILKPEPSSEHWGGFSILTPTPEKCDLAMRMLKGWMLDYELSQLQDKTTLFEYGHERPSHTQNIPNGNVRQTVSFSRSGEGGKIIGRNHENINKIAEKYNVKIRTFRTNDYRSYGGMVITGSPENCDSAVRKIRRRLWNNLVDDDIAWAEWDGMMS